MAAEGTLHLLIGPVGAGKTTYAVRKAAASRAVVLDLDSWMVRLFGADPRPQKDVMDWYLERRDRCRSLIWDVALDVLRCGSDVYLELGLIAAVEREAFYAKAHVEGLRWGIYLLDAPRDARRERVEHRNRTAGPTTQIVPLEFFERASDAWQPPSEAERATWNITDV
jgi:predicted kinase